MHFPKGSFHSHCLHRLQLKQINSHRSNNPNKEHRECKTSLTQRNNPNIYINNEQNCVMGRGKSSLTSRLKAKTTLLERNRLEGVDNFQEYLHMYEMEKRQNGQQIYSKNRANTINSNQQTHSYEKNEKNGKNNEKAVQNKKLLDQIIESHLPYFKCRLQRNLTTNTNNKNKFRVQQGKFRVIKNIVQNNSLSPYSNSLQIREF